MEEMVVEHRHDDIDDQLVARDEKSRIDSPLPLLHHEHQHCQIVLDVVLREKGSDKNQQGSSSWLDYCRETAGMMQPQEK